MIDLAGLGLYTFVMSITPGPNNVMLAASGVNFGFARTLPHMAGISFGFAAQAVLAASGFGAVFSQFPQLQSWLAWIGAAYLCYLAWRVLGSGGAADSRSARPLHAWEAAGFQLVNPKAWVMALTIGALFLPKSVNLAIALPLVFGVLVLVNFPCLCVWTAFGDAMGKLLGTAKWRVAFNSAMAVLLAGTALAMLVP